MERIVAPAVIIPVLMDPMTPHLQNPQMRASRRMRWVATVARLLLWLTLMAWVLFGASWAVLHGWIVPRIGEFRPRLEREASKALGVPVRIGQISARSGGMIPTFELHDVVLLDPQGREALRLPHLLAALSPTSVWSLGFEQLVIDQPVLDIRRTVDGRVYVGGLDVSQSPSDSNAVVNWFFSQPELSIQGGSLRWTDEWRAAPPLVLTQVDAVLRNGRRRHSMRIDATPPAEWGERFSLRGIFRQPLLSADAGHWRDWSGQAYAEFSRVDLSQVKRYASLESLGLDLKAGQGGVRAWADMNRGRLTGGTFDVALSGVVTQWDKALEPLSLATVAGRFGGRELANGLEFNTQDLRFNTTDGLAWPGGNLSVLHTAAQGQAAQKTELKADKLDLAALVLIANRLPLGTPTHALMASYVPKGLVEAVDARWQGPLDTPTSFSAKGRVSGLALASLPGAVVRPGGPTDRQAHERPGRPGIRGATIDFDVTQDGGSAALKVAHGALDLPGVFEDPLVLLDQLSLDAQWKRLNGKTEAQLRNIKFSNADAEGSAQSTWRSGDTALGTVDLQGSLSRGNGARVHRYLPLVLPERARHYVRDAVVQGDLGDVKFKVKGPVDEIPFSDPSKGEFKVSAKVKNGQFVYVPRTLQTQGAPAWPALTDLRGDLVFNRAALEVTGASGKMANLAGLQIVKADARIPDLLHSATLDLTARLKGPLADALGFVNTSPVGAMTGQVLAKAVASGSADYGLHLDLPLFAIEKTRVQGTVTLPGNDVQFMPATPVLTRLKGAVTFSEAGFNVAGAQARVLGGDIRFEGGMRPVSRTALASAETEPVVFFKAQGTLTSDGLQQARELGFLSRLAQNASGSTSYAASLGFRRGIAEVAVTSNLQGMALRLPAPLAKSAETALAVRFENTLIGDSLAVGQKLQDQLVLAVGRVASVVYVRDISGPDARVVRGTIGVGLEPGEPVPMPVSGVVANVLLDRVDLDAWDKVLSASAVSGTTPAPAVVPALADSRPPSAGLTLNYLPTQMAIRAGELVFSGRKLNNVVVGGTREGPNWRANIAATELNGYVEIRQPGATGPGRVYARLSRLNLGQSTASDVESILDNQPTSIPALDIVVDDLELRGKKLGRIEIDAVNRGALAVAREGGVREWRLNKFNIILPEAVLTATGNWAVVNAQAPLGAPAAGQRALRGATDRRRTVMNFKLDIADSGELLKRFGMVDVIRRGKGKMEGQVAWLGSPLSLDYPSMSGQFNVNMEGGQFLKADPGIAKLLGVLSLQSLPRRLTLDFRDVFSEGFAFDFVRGDITINQGLAATNNLQMKGVNAAVLMEGSADIARETQNIKVVVVPEIDAGTASLIATVINPAIGLGTFLAQYFLRRPLIQANTQEFQIDGSWTDPKITKVERKP